MKKIILLLLISLISIVSYSQVVDTMEINGSYLITKRDVMTKGFVKDFYQILFSINPPKGYMILFFESLAKADRIKYNDNTITMEMSAKAVDELQIGGGDLWISCDPWSLYPDGYYSGIGAEDLYTVRDYATNILYMDLSRTVIQADENNDKYVFPKYGLSGLMLLTEVKVPRTTTKIEVGAFKDCSNLRSVNGSCFMETLDRSIRHIDDGAEVDSTVLYNYDFSGIHEENEIIDNAFSNFTEIGDSAFYGVQAESIMLPKSFKRMGKAAFGNTNMKEVTFYGTEVPIIDVEAFGKHEKDSVILYVPKESLSKYREEYGNRFKAIREIGYISPNPVGIYLLKSQLHIDIREDASETGYVLINETNKVELKQGENIIDLKLDESYIIVVGEETFNLKRYEY